MSNKLHTGVLSRLRAANDKVAGTERQPQAQKITEGVPLARLIQRKLAVRPELVMLHKSRSMAAERFRRLKTILSNEQSGNPQVIVVTSGAPGEGKSLVSTNLALSFAADKQGDVLLIDGDLRRPVLDRWLTPPPKLGLAEILQEQTSIEHAIIELQNSPLKMLPAGAPPDDPVELLGSDTARELMATLRQRFSRIIVDTPPIVPFTDADVIGGLSDGVLLVARSGVTRKSVFARTMTSVTSARILGTVLNDVTFNLADRDGYYGDEKAYKAYYEDRDA